MTSIMAAEWLKLRTLRATRIGLAVLVLLVAGLVALTWYAVGLWDSVSPARQATGFISPMEPVAAQAAELCLAVIGVLAITTEYSSGSLGATFTAVPRRGRVVAAKAIVVAAVAAVVGTGAIMLTSVVTRAIAGHRRIAGLINPAYHTPKYLAALAAGVVVAALVGIGLGMLMRSTAGAITTFVMTVLFLPMVLQVVPGRGGEWVRSIMLDALPEQLAGIHGNPYSVYGSSLSPPGVLAVIVAYLVLTLGIGAVTVLRRDA